MPPLRGIALLAASAVTPGCLSGWLFTDVTTPVVVNMDNTPTATDVGELSNYEIRFRNVTWADVQSRAIGDAAAKNQLDTIHYADLRTLSVFGGLFKRRTIEVWGE